MFKPLTITIWTSLSVIITCTTREHPCRSTPRIMFLVLTLFVVCFPAVDHACLWGSASVRPRRGDQVLQVHHVDGRRQHRTSFRNFLPHALGGQSLRGVYPFLVVTPRM